jgi:hypothetical protein
LLRRQPLSRPKQFDDLCEHCIAVATHTEAGCAIEGDLWAAVRPWLIAFSSSTASILADFELVIRRIVPTCRERVVS